MFVNYFWGKEIFIFILFHLLTLLPSNFGTPQHIYSSLSWLPTLPSLARMNSPKHAPANTSSNQVIDYRRRHFQYLPAAPAQSPVSKGPLSTHTADTLPRQHHHRHMIRDRAVLPSPSTTPDCGQTCPEPLTSTPFGSPCGCVIPMKVELLLGVSVYAIFPVVNELEIEIAAGTYLKQSQVSIIGASADDENQEKTIVGINLVPLGEKFDDTTATLTYQRFLQKKVLLNRNLFGDYDVMYVSYPGLPPSGNLSGEGTSGGTVNQQDPITADIVGKNQKLTLRVVYAVASSACVLLVVCFATIFVILNCRKFWIPSNNGESVLASSINKRSGIGSKLSSRPASSTSASLVSAMPAFVLSVRTFSLAEVEKATENFSLKKVLGEGGFGRVYHGVLDDGTEVAVKLLMRGNQNGGREFISEIEMLSQLHHRNLVKLIGTCIEKQMRCLIYELVPNGSLESHLHGARRGKGPLDWDARLKIALGAARGLAYLHEDANPRVIHRDFKASNVLLENDFTPKVSDFGLAREATEGSDHISTQVMGTFGAFAGQSDVYSYGVVLLELLSGRKPIEMSQHPGQENLVTWARPLLTNQEGLKQLVDPSLAEKYNFDDMAKVAAIASMCVHPEVTHRPFMGEVVQALKLIYNDADQTCGDAYSQKGSSTNNSNFKVDCTPSDGSWWNAGGTAIHSTYGQDCSSGSPCELRNKLDSFENFGDLPTMHDNRLAPWRIVRSKRAFYELPGSMSEHGTMVAKRAEIGGRGYAGSF